MKYDVFGTEVEVLRSEGAWLVFYTGTGGLKRLAHDIVIPPHIAEAELATYLGDIRHEHASPQNSEVKCLV